MVTAVESVSRDAEKARERLDIRLRPEQKAVLEKAAHIKGLTLTDFILQHAVESARQAIRDYETWALERPDAELFAAALADASSPGPQLTAAAKRYRERFENRSGS